MVGYELNNAGWHAIAGLLCSLLIFTVRIAPAQQSGHDAVLSGKVSDARTGRALEGANVFLRDNGRGTSTNAHGKFRLDRLAAGSYTLIVRFIGYASAERRFTLRPGQELFFDIRLEPQPILSDEIIVVADSGSDGDQLFNAPLSQITLASRDLQHIPQMAEADLLRSLQILPGILAVSDFSSALFVRGGTADQSLYLLDGAEVYNPEHAFGLFSTFNTDAIERVKISKGGFDASYGDRLSAVIDVTHLDRNPGALRATTAISLLAANTTVQVPFGRSGALSGSLRRTYFDQTLAKMIDDVPDYYFYDGHLKFAWNPGPRDHFRLSVYKSNDFLNLIFRPEADDESGLTYAWGNELASGQWQHFFGNAWRTDIGMSQSRFRSNFQFGDDLPVTEKNNLRDMTLNAEALYAGRDGLQCRVGIQQKYLRTVFQQDFPGGLVDIQARVIQRAIFISIRLQPAPRLSIDSGLRYVDFRSTRSFRHLLPRFAVRFRLTDSASLKFSSGFYRQYLHQIDRAFIADIWTAANAFQVPSSAGHLILGFQTALQPGLSAELETYYKDYRDLYQFDQNFLTRLIPSRYQGGRPVYTDTHGLFHRGNGRSIGIELLIRKTRGTLSGWLGASVANTWFRFPLLNADRPFSPRHDRAVTLEVAGTLDVSNALRQLRGRPGTMEPGPWQLGFSLIYASGQPITTPGSGYFLNIIPNFQFFDLKLLPGSINNFRLPVYTRLDLSLTYEKRFTSWTLAPYLQIYNTGNRKNIWFIDYENSVEANSVVQEAKPVFMLPRLPSIGVKLTF